ncbi:MAG: hypothetical protein ACRCXQ_11725 [Vagococcus fluvialis]
MLISKSMINHFTRSFSDEDTVICYADSQTLSGASNKAILIMNHSTLHILFFNVNLSKVIQQVELSFTDFHDETFSNNPFALSSTWSFYTGKSKWRFRIMKKILTLGDMQKEFIIRIQEKIR